MRGHRDRRRNDLRATNDAVPAESGHVLIANSGHRPYGSHAMMRPTLLLLLTTAGCAATADGEWPSLARRPGEIESGTRAAPPLQAAAPETTVPEAPAGDAAPVAVAAGRTAAAAREFDEVEARWQSQRGATEAAVSAARGAAPSSQAWSKAQLELTRLERIGAEIAELRDRTDTIAGDLAQAAAQGSDVQAALAATGTLIARIEAGRAAHLQVFENAQRSLTR